MMDRLGEAMSFTRRYVGSLLASDLVDTGDLGERPRQGYPWWRRYLAALFDVPLAAARSPRASATAVNRAAASRSRESVTSSAHVRPQRAQSRFQPAPVRSASSGQRWTIAVALASAGLAGIFVLSPLDDGGASPGSPPTGHSTWDPMPTEPGGGTSAPGTSVPSEPAPSPSSDAGRVQWHGNLRLDSSAMTGGWWLDYVPPRPAATGDLYIQGSSNTLHSDGALVAWPGSGTPTQAQCAALLSSNRATQSLKVQVGAKACVGTWQRHVGWVEVTSIPDAQRMDVTATVWGRR